MRQKFFKYDLVRIATKLPPQMSHFHHEGELAYVVGSFADLYGGSNRSDFSLKHLEGGESSWWPASVLTLVKRRGKCPTCGSHFPFPVKQRRK